MGRCDTTGSININWHVERMNSLVTGFLFIFFVLSAGDADAGVYFSRQFSVPCSKCHSKIPLLNEFGDTFKSNGFALEKRAPLPKEAPPGTETVSAEPVVPSVGNGTEGANAKSGDTPATKTPSSTAESAQPASPPPPSPPKADYLFRAQTKDGSYIFSDNPLQVAKEADFKGTGGRPVTAVKKTKATAIKNQPVIPVITEKMHHKKPATVKRATGIRKNSSAAKSPEIIAKSKPLNFESCMENILLKADLPESGTEAMEQFVNAERSCSRYSATR